MFPIQTHFLFFASGERNGGRKFQNPDWEKVLKGRRGRGDTVI